MSKKNYWQYGVDRLNYVQEKSIRKKIVRQQIIEIKESDRHQKTLLPKVNINYGDIANVLNKYSKFGKYYRKRRSFIKKIFSPHGRSSRKTMIKELDSTLSNFIKYKNSDTYENLNNTLEKIKNELKKESSSYKFGSSKLLKIVDEIQDNIKTDKNYLGCHLLNKTGL